MKPLAVQTLRSRWFAACVHGALWLLLYLAVVHLGGQAPVLRDSEAFTPPPESPVPVAKLDGLFSTSIWPHLLAASNAVANPFLTSYFAPAQVPPVPPPTTTKVELTYLGYYEAATGPKQAVVKLFNSFVISPLGARVASNLFIADVTMQTLTLTNPLAKTNMLTVNKKQDIEVPLK
jgi:hypothetical protein